MGLTILLGQDQGPPQRKRLGFVSFRKGCHRDIVPTTISSWFKQTVLLCFQLSDEAAPIFIRLEPMMLGVLQPFCMLRLFREESRWTRSSQPVTGKPTNFYQVLPEGLGLGGFRTVSFGPRGGSPTVS